MTQGMSMVKWGMVLEGMVQGTSMVKWGMVLEGVWSRG